MTKQCTFIIYFESFHKLFQMLPPSLPVVVKVGSANSGYGKVASLKDTMTPFFGRSKIIMQIDKKKKAN